MAVAKAGRVVTAVCAWEIRRRRAMASGAVAWAARGAASGLASTWELLSLRRWRHHHLLGESWLASGRKGQPEQPRVAQQPCRLLRRVGSVATARARRGVHTMHRIALGMRLVKRLKQPERLGRVGAKEAGGQWANIAKLVGSK